MNLIHQCCGGVCDNNPQCEKAAWKQYQKQRMVVYKELLTNRIALVIIGAIIGFMIGRLI